MKKAKKDFYSFEKTGVCCRRDTPKAPAFCPYLVGEADEKIKVSPFSAGFRRGGVYEKNQNKFLFLR
jgi:hypothetical protein